MEVGTELRWEGLQSSGNSKELIKRGGIELIDEKRSEPK
jgi:hypothetical protein